MSICTRTFRRGGYLHCVIFRNVFLNIFMRVENKGMYGWKAICSCFTEKKKTHTHTIMHKKKNYLHRDSRVYPQLPMNGFRVSIPCVERDRGANERRIILFWYSKVVRGEHPVCAFIVIWLYVRSDVDNWSDWVYIDVFYPLWHCRSVIRTRNHY